MYSNKLLVWEGTTTRPYRSTSHAPRHRKPVVLGLIPESRRFGVALYAHMMHVGDHPLTDCLPSFSSICYSQHGQSRGSIKQRLYKLLIPISSLKRNFC